jgi:hypothetical protein
MNMASTKPKLRPLDFQPVFHQGQQLWLLRDPLQLSEQQLVVPAVLAQMLLYCDGTHTPHEIHRAFCRQVGEAAPFSVIEEALAQLDDAYLLDNERAAAAKEALLATYRAGPYRAPALADRSYPADPEQLSDLFSRYGRENGAGATPSWAGRGLISPHIDYQRGGPVYAQVWRRAETAVRDADLVLIFGTDHNGGLGTVTLTRQPYATPYGVLPAAPALIDAVAEAIGPERAFAEELHHRDEHSVELSAVWLHHIYRKIGMAPRPMLPILCGSFHHFVSNGRHPEEDERLTAVIETLRRETAGKKVLAVASVDLAHVGPTFGDSFIMDQSRRAALRRADERLIEAILAGDAAGFYDQIAGVGDKNRICGFSSIYLMLRYLENESGARVAYEQCAADPEDNSLVSICGLLLD